MERRQRELLEAQETIRRLEEQLRQLQKAKEELEVSQKELHSMMKRLEEAKEMEMVEKIKLEEEIRAKQEEVQRIADEVQRKDEETRRLQVIPLSHLIIYKSANWILIILNNWIIFFYAQDEVEEARKRQEEAAAALIAATTTPQHQHVTEGDQVLFRFSGHCQVSIHYFFFCTNRTREMTMKHPMAMLVVAVTWFRKARWKPPSVTLLRTVKLWRKRTSASKRSSK